MPGLPAHQTGYVDVPSSPGDADTIANSTTMAALLTPEVPSAIATIAIVGPRADEMAAQSLRSERGSALALGDQQARFGKWLSTSKMPAEHVVAVKRNPQWIEIHCHGGLAVCRMILSDLEQSGCLIQSAEQLSCGLPSAYPLVDPSTNYASPWAQAIQRELAAAAEQALPRAGTIKVATILLDQWQGALAREIIFIDELVRGGKLDQAQSIFQDLIARASFGYKLLAPWKFTLAGPPNVGKSSLLNALSGAARVLVHHEPGTTRDAIDTTLVIAGWPVVLTDTAGVRATDEDIERQGITAARARWQTADVGVVVIDATVGWTETHRELLTARVRDNVAEPAQYKIIAVVNKYDQRPNDGVLANVVQSIEECIPAESLIGVATTTAIAPEGTSHLLQLIGQWLDSQAPPAGAGVPFTLNQVELVRSLAQR
ncbi:MAG: 50S ribosome-binding GTPase [Pirellulaceae bacterium]|nr:50S ribosome-binding GTPase [Pirellulaceae bacterium]